ncbi:MAG TPA: bifunctional transaldolase/phosoglucose isomerase [Candidatus Dormibacteraeota bacterium]
MATATRTKLSPLQQLLEAGQSLWYDNIRRQLITSGELARMRDEGVRGVTSNPTIFQKAISGSTDYDEALVERAKRGVSVERILWDLFVEDIQGAADVFRPVYDQSGGADGFVSLEVSPERANNTRATIRMAKDLWKRAARPNVMIKIPGTREGLPAIRQMLAAGININITLIFSVERYVEVVEAFMSGLEDRLDAGGDISGIASVASFFVSRVDTKVDKLLDARLEKAGAAEKRALEPLLGNAGVANSKEAYQRFKELHSGPRWDRLSKAGARVQRCLWASTSVKDPRYPELMYVEELIGPDTVDTVPPATLVAFRERGTVRRTLDADVDEARRQLKALAANGIDLAEVTHELEIEGVEAFSKSFDDLRKTIAAEVKAIKAGRGPRQWARLGQLAPAVEKQIADLQKNEVARRLWAKDATLWGATGAAAKEVQDRLGWLTVAEQLLGDRARLREVAREGKRFADVVLLGMGGSSLCPDVFRNTFGKAPGHPELHVLDTTDPESILDVRKAIRPQETLFIVASKSGTTTETLSHFAYFWGETEAAVGAKAGRHFAAITDPGTSLEKLAKEHGFRWTFKNPPDIGGRYSALSYFGMVPGALMGVDVVEMLERAGEMQQACDPTQPVEKNPGVWLGAVLGRLAKDGRDKVTLVLSPKVATYGYWVEQLLAESTGKEGKGLIPIEGEPLGPPSAYGDDRVFVHVRMEADKDNRAINVLEKAGQPVVTLTLRDKLDLGGEFLRWEVATAVAGSILGIDAFDQPNVQESKDNTKKVLEQFKKAGRLPAAESVAAADSADALRGLLKRAKKGAYVALMAYTERTRTSERSLAQIRATLRDATSLATTAGYGPRFLHSTGQLHKGGPRIGLFVQVVQEDREDLAIPGEPYSFSVLKQAQALGDLESLRSRELPVVRVTLGRTPAKGWRALAAAAAQATAK